MELFWYWAATILGGVMAGFVGGTGAHAFAKRYNTPIDMNNADYGMPMILSVAISALLSGVVHFNIFAAWGLGASIVSLILTLPACLIVLVSVLHGPHVVTVAANKLADKLLSLIGSGSDEKKG
ncbi:MAG: hypothetical protein K2W95_28680 [Candidatus Obscuribacterales bacterium]|nr:hypothetical protein [Candidatus Obscuribacterales bacterium]